MRAILVSVFLGAISAGAQPVEFKGLRLGSDRAALDQWMVSLGMKCAEAGDVCRVLPVETCAAQMPPMPSANLPSGEFSKRLAERKAILDACLQQISAKRTFAQVPTSAPAVTLRSGMIESVAISFAGEHYAAVFAALREKYDSPNATEHPQWQNKAGASFDNEVVTWRRADGLITLSMRSSDRDRSSLTMYAPGALERRASEVKDAAKKAVGDM